MSDPKRDKLDSLKVRLSEIEAAIKNSEREEGFLRMQRIVARIERLEILGEIKELESR